MQRKIFCLIAMIQFLCLCSQTDDLNHQKYWYYRTRLTNDFMKIGSAPGESLPMSHRSINDYAGPAVQFGADEVSQLGPYICVLATEYQLLKNSGQNTDSTKQELFYALDAFNRLDYAAEPVYGYPSSLDGFFIRQDVPCDFIKNNIYHFNYDLNMVPPGTWLPNYTSPNYSPFDTDTDHSTHPNADPLQYWAQYGQLGGFCSKSYVNRIIAKDPAFIGYEPYCRWSQTPSSGTFQDELAMSLDQCINMFNACALINKYFTTSDSYNGQPFLDGNVDFQSEARAISGRILNTLQGPHGLWVIKKPDGNPPGVGANSNAYSFPFSEADCKIHKTNTQQHSVNACIADENFLSATIGYTSWNSTTSIAGTQIDALHPDNAPKTAGLEAACNCDYSVNIASIIIGYVYSIVEYVIGWFHHWFQGAPVPVFGSVTNFLNITSDRIENRSGLFDLQWAPLLRKVLHGGANNSYNGFNYKQLLNDAPCDGPHYYSESDPHLPLSPWTSVDNIDHAPDRSILGNADKHKGEFNGLDYMLYHNLYYIDNPQYYPGVADLRYRIMTTFNFPTPGTPSVGNNTSPALIRSYEYIEASNILNAPNPTSSNDPNNANVTYEAGKQIHLKDGFSVNTGSTFHAFIERPGCLNNNTRVVHDTIVTSPTTQIYNQPTEFVTYAPAPAESETQPVPPIPPLVKGKIIQNSTTSNTTSYEFLNVYPNPTSGSFTAEFALHPGETAGTSIINSLGDVVYRVQTVGGTFNKLDINQAKLSKGVYFVKVTTNTGRNLTQKIIVQ